ncbi:metallophosphoesterase family protein [Frigidibacter oleivorans]|uniref:metallophosphoesterase family protein n=1 Tax=Frigidibacter oleivorans TaxID=2487129 RepID=UPI0013DF1FE4|nr:metallophosphoesterase [Frigidibacter oleivorans]
MTPGINRQANARTLRVLEQIAAAKPDCVLHMGDVVNPLPQEPTYPEVSRFAARLMAPFDLTIHIAPGNHDVGDKLAFVTPAHGIDEATVALFDKLVRPNWSAFDLGPVRTLIINASLIGSGLPQEAEQWDWLERELSAHQDRRLFLATHYPVFMGQPDEGSLYDNIEPEGRTRLLGLLEAYAVEAVFAGHVHNFFHHVLGPTEFHILPSPSFVRQDYAELASVAPDNDGGMEGGRNDTAKLGWAMVEIFEEGHVVHIHRSEMPADAAMETAPRNHPKFRSEGLPGLQLRHAWAEPGIIPLNGPIEEFTRRRQRNDYPLLALQEMGTRDLRAPLTDLDDPLYLRRAEDLGQMGYRFTFFSLGVPSDALAAKAASLPAAAALEVILPWRRIAELTAALTAFRQVWKGPLTVACTVSASDHREVSVGASYTVTFGFDISEFGLLATFHAETGAALDLGYCFRLAEFQDVLTDGRKIADFAARMDVPASLHVTLGGEHPGLVQRTEAQVAARVVEAAVLAKTTPLTVFLDRPADVDRSYFPGFGLYDRLWNPRLPGRALAAATRLLAGSQRAELLGVETGGAARICRLSLNGRVLELAIPTDGETPAGFSPLVTAAPGLPGWRITSQEAQA